LPASPFIGDTISITCATSGAVVIQANTGQIIQIGSDASTSAGTATSSAKGDSIELVYNPSDTTWYSKNGPQGIWTTA
jgi:predicted ribosome-associated RNA-binding protein Tma20